MKVNWRKNVARTLVATGLLSPAAATAANLDTNLVVNPGFESVDFGTTGDYGSPKINNWIGDGFAYSHNGTGGIPDYADGADPPGAGNWYFTANNQPAAGTGDIREPNIFYQDLDVSTGATATQISSGEAAFNLAAYMSSYDEDNDFGIARLEFRDSGGNSLGFHEIRDSDAGPENVWSLNSAFGAIPAATKSMRLSLFGGVVNSGTDGYIDNVDAQVTAAENVLTSRNINTFSAAVTCASTLSM